MKVAYPNPDVTEKACLDELLVRDYFVDGIRNSYGEINEISLLEPDPGEVGFCKVVSTSVHPSPLSPQLPVTAVSNGRRTG